MAHENADVAIDDSTLFVVHPNGETFSESYEVIYELDPEYRKCQANDLAQYRGTDSVKANDLRHTSF